MSPLSPLTYCNYLIKMHHCGIFTVARLTMPGTVLTEGAGALADIPVISDLFSHTPWNIKMDQVVVFFYSCMRKPCKLNVGQNIMRCCVGCYRKLEFSAAVAVPGPLEWGKTGKAQRIRGKCIAAVLIMVQKTQGLGCWGRQSSAAGISHRTSKQTQSP